MTLAGCRINGPRNLTFTSRMPEKPMPSEHKPPAIALDHLLDGKDVDDWNELVHYSRIRYVLGRGAG